MQLEIAGQQLVHVYFDYGLILRSDHQAEIRISTKYAIQVPGEPEEFFDPELTESPMPGELAGLRQQVTEAVADEETGSLAIRLENGVQVHVPPDKRYEAWTFSDPSGSRVVALPGGGLAVWSARDE
jgi:Family of unknown function (DUF6188)